MPVLTLDHVLTLEHKGWRALCEPGGGARFYGDLMTDDGIMVLAGGMVLDRAGVVASLAEAPPWASYEMTEPRAVHLGEAASVLLYRAVATRGAGDTFRAFMASTYCIRDGRVRLAVHQQTPDA